MQRYRSRQVRKQPCRLSRPCTQIALVDCPSRTRLENQRAYLRELPNACWGLTVHSAPQILRMLPQKVFPSGNLQSRSPCTLLNEEVPPNGQLSLAGLQPGKTPDVSGAAQRLCTEFPGVSETRAAPGGTRWGKHDHIPVTICDLSKQAFPYCRVQQVRSCISLNIHLSQDQIIAFSSNHRQQERANISGPQQISTARESPRP